MSVYDCLALLDVHTGDPDKAVTLSRDLSLPFAPVAGTVIAFSHRLCDNDVPPHVLATRNVIYLTTSQLFLLEFEFVGATEISVEEWAEAFRSEDDQWIVADKKYSWHERHGLPF